MKKLLLFLFLLTLPANAAELNANPIPFETELLSQKYSGYEIILKNNENSPLKINNIDLKNASNDAERLQSSYVTTSKKYRTLMTLSPFTLGLTGLAALPVQHKDLEKVKTGSAEAVKFSSTKLQTYKETVLMPEQEIKMLVAVPLNEKPDIVFVLQNIKTNQFKTVSLK